MRLHALTMLAVIVASSASADEIAPGDKGVSHGIYVEGLDRFPRYTFFVFPIRIGSGAARVVTGQPLSFYKYAGPRLYALSGRVTGTPADSLFSSPEVPRSEEPFRMISTIPATDPTRVIKTIYRVKAIEGTVIKLERVSEERISEGGSPSDGLLAALSAAGMLGLGIAAVRRRR